MKKRYFLFILFFLVLVVIGWSLSRKTSTYTVTPTKKSETTGSTIEKIGEDKPAEERQRSPRDLLFVAPSYDDLSPNFDNKEVDQSDRDDSKNLTIKIKPTEEILHNFKSHDYRLLDTIQSIDAKNLPAKVEVQINF